MVHSEVQLWIMHYQSIAFALVGVTQIAIGWAIRIAIGFLSEDMTKITLTHLQFQCYICGILSLVCGVLCGLWHSRRKRSYGHILHMVLIIMAIICTLILGISILLKCTQSQALLLVDKLWHDMYNNNYAFFMLQQSLRCCGKTDESDFVEPEDIPVCYRYFIEEKEYKFTIGCNAAIEKYVDRKAIYTIVEAVIMISVQGHGLGLCISLFKTMEPI